MSSKRVVRGCVTGFVTTGSVGGLALAIGFYTGLVGPCPQPKDWVPEWLGVAIALGLLGAPLLGAVLGILAARRAEPEQDA